jgi:hypothetical protein
MNPVDAPHRKPNRGLRMQGTPLIAGSAQRDEAADSNCAETGVDRGVVR